MTEGHHHRVLRRACARCIYPEEAPVHDPKQVRTVIGSHEFDPLPEGPP